MNPELTEGYHRDPEKMLHHYDLELVWCTYPSTKCICVLGHVDHMKDTKSMLYDMFTQYPKSHWQCWAPYMRGTDKANPDGLWIRVHHTADFEWRHWDTWRLWRPWKEWMNVNTYERAVEVAKTLGRIGQEVEE